MDNVYAPIRRFMDKMLRSIPINGLFYYDSVVHLATTVVRRNVGAYAVTKARVVGHHTRRFTSSPKYIARHEYRAIFHIDDAEHLCGFAFALLVHPQVCSGVDSKVAVRVCVETSTCGSNAPGVIICPTSIGIATAAATTVARCNTVALFGNVGWVPIVWVASFPWAPLACFDIAHCVDI
jgi:hypothetical protein